MRKVGNHLASSLLLALFKISDEQEIKQVSLVSLLASCSSWSLEVLLEESVQELKIKWAFFSWLWLVGFCFVFLFYFEARISHG